MNKKCSHCGKVKDLSQFGKWKFGKDGLRPTCKSCKAKQDKRYKEYNREYMKHYYSYTARGRYFRLKQNAKDENSFTINPEEFITWYDNQPRTCYYCGQALTAGIWKKPKHSDLSIDRKDNKQGYALDNIALCCRRCNLMKGDWLTESQMLEIAQKYFRG